MSGVVWIWTLFSFSNEVLAYIAPDEILHQLTDSFKRIGQLMHMDLRFL